MSESLPPQSLKEKLLGQVETDPAAYCLERAESIVSGRATWLVRDWRDPEAQVYDYYVGGEQVAGLEREQMTLGKIFIFDMVTNPKGEPVAVAASLGAAVAAAETLYRPNSRSGPMV